MKTHILERLLQAVPTIKMVRFLLTKYWGVRNGWHAIVLDILIVGLVTCSTGGMRRVSLLCQLARRPILGYF